MPYRVTTLLILLTAAVFRLYGLNNLSPPGLEHDEVANWLIDRSILDGNHAIYFSDAYGHEAGFHYLQTAFVALLGDHALALRLPAAFAGLLLVAVSFALARQLFGTNTALMSAGLLALLFWPVFYSRLGLRAITLPLLSALSAYSWWRAWSEERRAGSVERGAGNATRRPADSQTRKPANSQTRKPTNSQTRKLANPQTRHFLLAGFLAGLSMHTYMAARAVPIFYGLFVVYLALVHGPEFKERWRGVLMFGLVYLVVAAPLLVYLQTNPGSEFRITEIDAPLRALLAGDLRPVWANGVKILGMFGFAGDPLWRQNVSGAPVFEPAVAALFYLGLLLCLWRWRDGRYAFLLLWLATAAIPSLVTVDAPSSIRMINALPVLTLLPSLLIHNLGELSTVFNRLSTGIGYFGGKVGLTILIFYYMGLTGWAIFRVWPQNDEVQFVWQAALTETAVYLDATPDTGPVAIGGWTPGTMDPPTIALTLRRDDLDLSYFDPISSLIIPAAADGETARILHPTMLELNPLFAGQLKTWGASVQVIDGFTLYTLPAVPTVRPQFPADVVFGDQIQFLGYDLLSPSAPLEMVTYWQVVAPVTGPRRLFLHLLDDGGNLLAEEYALDKADARSQVHWQVGDLILQHHVVGETAVSAHLRLGIFDPNSCPPPPCQNLPTRDGAEHIQLRVGE